MKRDGWITGHRKEKGKAKDIDNKGETLAKDARKTGTGTCVKRIISGTKKKVTHLNQGCYQGDRKLSKVDPEDMEGTMIGNSSESEIHRRRLKEIDQ